MGIEKFFVNSWGRRDEIKSFLLQFSECDLKKEVFGPEICQDYDILVINTEANVIQLYSRKLLPYIDYNITGISIEMCEQLPNHWDCSPIHTWVRFESDNWNSE